ncbi:MAG: high-affinity branched-chain amino acid ABC transporter ATP-binding protein LivG [Gammaproteobacteria bacterium]|nr:high-affinity branched-chain amino acid ABC transporter ATP-binding protein LivG [Gammaproteobacteria bacterium]
MSDSLLIVKGLAMQFGGLLAVDELSFNIAPKEIVAIIGPNGAGKTTVFNCLSGFYRPTSGTIHFMGRAIERASSHQISRLGLVRTFQNIRLFKQMTVVENLLVAQYTLSDTRLWSGLFKSRNFLQKEEEALQNASNWLSLLGLKQDANREAGNLPYGQQRRLEIARCMVTQPKLLLLDEPAAGLNPIETSELKILIEQLRTEFGVTVLLIEHDMSLVMEISDKIVVLESGRPIAEGSPVEIQNSEKVIKAYLGDS